MASDPVRAARPQIGPHELSAVAEALRDDRLMQGPRVLEFEEQFADYIGTEYAVAVSSGTAALQAALSFYVDPGDHVLVPSMGFFAFVEAVFHAWAMPVFVDVDGTHCMAPQDVPLRITPKTSAAIVVHLYGGPASLYALRDELGDIPIIEDCAQAHGTEHGNRRVGSIGEAGCFSFMATKHMTTLEGGMVTTNDPGLAKYIRRYRVHGMASRHTHGGIGHNFKMSEPQAALGSTQLRRLEELNEARTIAAARMSVVFGGRDGVDWLEPLPGPAEASTSHTFFWLPVLVDERKIGMRTELVVERLNRAGIQCRFRYLEPIFKQQALREMARYWQAAGWELPQQYDQLRLPGAEKFSGRTIGLPCRPDMAQQEVERTLEALREIPLSKAKRALRHIRGMIE